jgi:hypothetical protein
MAADLCWSDLRKSDLRKFLTGGAQQCRRRWRFDSILAALNVFYSY